MLNFLSLPLWVDPFSVIRIFIRLFPCYFMQFISYRNVKPNSWVTKEKFLWPKIKQKIFFCNYTAWNSIWPNNSKFTERSIVILLLIKRSFLMLVVELRLISTGSYVTTYLITNKQRQYRNWTKVIFLLWNYTKDRNL